MSGETPDPPREVLIEGSKSLNGSEPVEAANSNVGIARRDRPELSCRIYSARHKRRTFFDEDLFSEPVWDMLLVLHCAGSSGKQLTVSSVARAGDVPYSTGFRWLTVLQERGLVHRTAHPADARSSFVTLTDAGRSRMERYLDRVGREELA